MTLGEKIKKLRGEKGLTQKDLANQVHVTFQTVSKWEKNENEPDVSTLRELAKLFECSMDYLLSEDDSKKEESAPEETAVKEESVKETVVIREVETHICEKCKKSIPSDELVMEKICVEHARRGHQAVYREGYYHKACLDAIHEEKRRIEEANKKERAKSGALKSFIWGGIAGVIALVSVLLYCLNEPTINTGMSILYSVIAGYGGFSMIYCIVCGSYLGEVFVWCAGLSIKFPGLIFSWSIEGFIWVICMKILFAIIGFIVGVLALIFAIALSAALGMVSFPFVLIHNIRTGYDDII